MFAERLGTPDQRHARVGEALQQVHEVHEAVEVVLEPQHDLALRRRGVEALLLFEEVGAHAQEIVAVALRERARARLDPLVAGHDRAGDERLAIRDVLAGDAAAPRQRRDDVAVVNVHHGRHRIPTHHFVSS